MNSLSFTVNVVFGFSSDFIVLMYFNKLITIIIITTTTTATCHSGLCFGWSMGWRGPLESKAYRFLWGWHWLEGNSVSTQSSGARTESRTHTYQQLKSIQQLIQSAYRAHSISCSNVTVGKNVQSVSAGAPGAQNRRRQTTLHKLISTYRMNLRGRPRCRC
jgi:hypothetical protein